MTKKLVRSVERKGMVEVKNTGKGQSQGQAVKINIKIGDTTAQKKKEEEKKKQAKKRRAKKRAKKKLIEQIQEELKTIQNLKQDAKDRGISIPAELGALPISVPTSMKGLVELQKEMAERVVALQEYIASQSQESEVPQIQPQIIPAQGVPAPPIEFQQELIRQRERLVELGDKGSGVEPKKPVKPVEPKPAERPEELTPPVPTPQPTAPADDDTAELIERLLDDNIKKQKKRLDALVAKGEMTKEDADRELKALIDSAKEEDDKTISAKLGETERKGFEKLMKEKENYERKAKQIAKDIIKATKAKKSKMYYIDKRDVEELEFEREENLSNSQDYQTKYARVIAENGEIFGDFFRQSDILYQPNTPRGLIKAFIENIEKDFREGTASGASEEDVEFVEDPTKPIPDKEREEKQAQDNLKLRQEITEIRMETNDIAQDIKETLDRSNQRATQGLVKRVQGGLKDTLERYRALNQRLSNLLARPQYITRETTNHIKEALKVINKNRSKATKFLTNVRGGITKVVPDIPLNPTKETALKRLKEFIALRDDIKKPNNAYEISGFKDLIGNKALWDLIMKEPTKRLKYSNLQSQLDQWVQQNPNYEADIGEQMTIEDDLLPFQSFKLPPIKNIKEEDIVIPKPKPKEPVIVSNRPPRSEVVEEKTRVKMGRTPSGRDIEGDFI